MASSLTYLEEKLLHPTRGARFESARRMRLTHQYAMWGQGLSAVALIAWSLVPMFFPRLKENGNLELFSIVASVYILALTMHQQASAYIDKARSLEASARRVDALRKDVHASIMDGLDDDPTEYREKSRLYSEILEDNPINHDSFDYLLSSSKQGTFRYYWLRFQLHMRAGISLILCIVFVVVLPAGIAFHAQALSQDANSDGADKMVRQIAK